MQPLHNRPTARVIGLVIFLAASFWPLHAAQLVSLNVDQVSYTATHSGNVPCTEYGHLTVSVSQDPGVVQYLQVTASFSGNPPAWLARNLVVPDFISNASTTVDLTQLGIARGTCVAGLSLLYGATFTDMPIDTAPTIDPTSTVSFGTRNNKAEGFIPKGDVFPGSLAAGGPPSAFNFQGGQTEQINRAGMGSVVQGNNECGPGAATNSLHWLNDSGSINLGGDTPDQSLQKLKSDMKPSGWDGRGVSDTQFVSGKLQFAQRAEHILNLDIHYQADSGVRSDLPASVTVGNMTAMRDGNGGPPTIEYLRQQMELGQDVELLIEYLKDDGITVTGGHAVAVSGYSRAGNLDAVWFNDDAFQDGTVNGLRTYHLAKIEREGNYLKLAGEQRNRVAAIVCESPRTTFTVGYVVNVIANTVSGFLENPLGQLIPLSGFPIPALGGPTSATHSRTGTVQISNYFANDVGNYDVDSAGRLTLRQAIMAGTDPISMVLATRGGQEYLFAADEGSNDVYEYQLSAGGDLMIPRVIPLRGASFPESIVATKDGQNVYVVSCGNMNCNGQGKVNILSVDLNGNVTENQNSPVNVGQGSVSGALDTAGGRLFTVDQASGTITELDRNVNTGDLTPHGIMPVGPGGSSIVVDPRDQVAIVTVGQFNAGLVFKYNETTGTLTLTSTFTTGAFPTSGNFDPIGVHYYETNAQGGSIGGLTINFETGTAVHIPGDPWPTDPGPFDSIFVQLQGSPPPQP